MAVYAPGLGIYKNESDIFELFIVHIYELAIVPFYELFIVNIYELFILFWL